MEGGTEGGGAGFRALVQETLHKRRTESFWRGARVLCGFAEKRKKKGWVCRAGVCRVCVTTIIQPDWSVVGCHGAEEVQTSRTGE